VPWNVIAITLAKVFLAPPAIAVACSSPPAPVAFRDPDQRLISAADPFDATGAGWRGVQEVLTVEQQAALGLQRGVGAEALTNGTGATSRAELLPEIAMSPDEPERKINIQFERIVKCARLGETHRASENSSQTAEIYVLIKGC
jgi:hypothetical protein